MADRRCARSISRWALWSASSLRWHRRQAHWAALGSARPSRPVLDQPRLRNWRTCGRGGQNIKSRCDIGTQRWQCGVESVARRPTQSLGQWARAARAGQGLNSGILRGSRHPAGSSTCVRLLGSRDAGATRLSHTAARLVPAALPRFAPPSLLCPTLCGVVAHVTVWLPGVVHEVYLRNARGAFQGRLVFSYLCCVSLRLCVVHV